MWTLGSFMKMQKYDQSYYLKKILNSPKYNELYRFLYSKYEYADLAVSEDNPLNVKNWKEGQEILFPLTSTTADKSLEDKIKKDLGFKKFDYYITFFDTKGYKINYENIKGLETPWQDYNPKFTHQAEVLIAGRFRITKIYSKDNKTFVELKAVSQSKEDMKNILKVAFDTNTQNMKVWRDNQGKDSVSQTFDNYEKLKTMTYLFQTETDKERELKRLQKLSPSTIEDFVNISLKVAIHKPVTHVFHVPEKILKDYYFYGCEKVIPNFKKDLDVKYIYEYRDQVWEYLTSIKEDELKEFLKSENILPSEGKWREKDWYDYEGDDGAPIYTQDGEKLATGYSNPDGISAREFKFILDFKTFYYDTFDRMFSYFSKIKDQIKDLQNSDLQESTIDYKSLAASIAEEDEELKENWIEAAIEYEDIFGRDILDNILTTPIYYRDGFIGSNNKSALAITRLTTNGLIVLFSTYIDALNDDKYWNVLLHEMCHLASYFKYGDLDMKHVKGWKEFADKINKFRKDKLTPTADEKYFVESRRKLFEVLDKDDQVIQRILQTILDTLPDAHQIKVRKIDKDLYCVYCRDKDESRQVFTFTYHDSSSSIYIDPVSGTEYYTNRKKSALTCRWDNNGNIKIKVPVYKRDFTLPPFEFEDKLKESRCRYKPLLKKVRIKEADKTRFIKKALDAADLQDDGLYNETLEAFQKFVNSGAADKFKIDWQQRPLLLYGDLLKAYGDYQEQGGSNKDKNEAKRQNPKLIFQKSYLSENVDYVFLDNLENDDYLFVVPLTWECCQFMNNFECGGKGARWCIGYEKDSKYYEDYVYRKGNLFCLALNKKELFKNSKTVNGLKYMIEFGMSKMIASSGKATTFLAPTIWKQTDFEEEELETLKVFNIKSYRYFVIEIVNAIQTKVEDCDYKHSKIWNDWVDAVENNTFF